MAPRRPYRQEGARPEALLVRDPDADEPAAERDRCRGGQGAPRARRPTAAAARVTRRRSRPARADAQPPAQPAPREPPLAGQRDEILGAEGRREAVARRGQAHGLRGRVAGEVASRDRAPPRSCAEGGGRRGRAGAGRRGRAGRARTPARRRTGRRARAGGTARSRRTRPWAPRRACARARRRARAARATRRSATAPRWRRPRRAPAPRARRRDRAAAARTGRASAAKCSSWSACTTSCAITERGADPPEPST